MSIEYGVISLVKATFSFILSVAKELSKMESLLLEFSAYVDIS